MQKGLWNLTKQCHKPTARISKVFTKDVWNATPQAYCTSNITHHWLMYSAEQSWCFLHNLKGTHYHCCQFLCRFCRSVLQHSFNPTPEKEIKWRQVKRLQRPGSWSTPPNPMLGKWSIEAVVDSVSIVHWYPCNWYHICWCIYNHLSSCTSGRVCESLWCV